MKILTHRVSLQSSNSNFQKKAAILNFRIFRKIAKHRNAYISQNCASHLNFQNIFVLPKMAAILNFLIFRKKCLYLENRAR